MNKIVKYHYPVENLPVDLREVLGSARTVTVTLQPETGTRPTAAEVFEAMVTERDKLKTRSPVDGAARIRTLRDEWDA